MTTKTKRGRTNQLDADVYETLNVPRACIYFDSTTANGSGAVASGAQWDVIWDSVSYDSDGMWDPTLPKRLTVKTTGLYLWTAQIAWINNAFGDRLAYFVKNNSFPFGTTYDPTTVAFPMFQFLSCPQPMNAGDYVMLRVTQNSAAGVGLYQTLGNNGFQATLISTI